MIDRMPRGREAVTHDLMEWADEHNKPEPPEFSRWRFSEDQLELLREACQSEGAAEALAMALHHFTDETIVMRFVEFAAERSSL